MNNIVSLFSNKQFQNIAIAQLFTVYGTNVILPVMPIYLKFQGFSESQIGLIMGIAALGALVMRPLVGYTVDVKGCRMAVLLGQFLNFICLTAYFWVITFLPLVVLRFMQGVAFAFYGTGAVAFASSVEVPNKAAGAISMYAVFTMLGLGVATGSAPLLFEMFGFKNLIFISLFFLCLGSSIILIRAKKIPPCLSEQRVPFLQVLKTKEVLAPTVCLFASNFAFSTCFTFIPLLSVAEKIPFYAVFYIAFTFAVVSARLFVNDLVEKYTAQVVSAYASVLNALSVFILAIFPSYITFAISGILVGLGFGAIFPSLAVFVVNNTSPANKGTGLSILSASGDIGSALGAAVLGVIAEYYGFSALFISSTVIVIVCTYYFYTVLVKPKI